MLTSLYGNAGNEELAVLIILAVLITFRTYRNLKLRRVNVVRLYFSPIFYMILSVLSLIAITMTPEFVLIFVFIVAAGTVIGFIFGGNVEFRELDTGTYYKRSVLIIFVWLASFIARAITGYLLPTSFYANFGITLLLALTAGMLLGEAVRINREYNTHKNHGNK